MLLATRVQSVFFVPGGFTVNGVPMGVTLVIVLAVVGICLLLGAVAVVVAIVATDRNRNSRDD